ncbi:MAG TPA: outer membrane lipoprotein-sorting protein [Steroidobacteraceae bacterium]|nr:outer membrane lipoprotein-sorting protein [Steroidobacteraceae bacterium]
MSALLVARRTLLRTLAVGGMSTAVAPLGRSQVSEGREMLDKVEKPLWGSTVQGEYETTITTPRRQPTLGLRLSMDRPRRSFVRILSSAKEAGIGSLRIGTEMWNYLPNVERIVKIPPSMMLQPWMGSDVTNDDLVKESSILDDYTHKVLATVQLDGEAVVQVEAVPKPDAAVVWGRIVYWVRRTDTMPLKQEFFSERGERVRVLAFSDVRKVGGRVLPTRWDIRLDAKPGNSTTVVFKDAVFDRPVDDEIFSQRHLQRRWAPTPRAVFGATRCRR